MATKTMTFGTSTASVDVSIPYGYIAANELKMRDSSVGNMTARTVIQCKDDGAGNNGANGADILIGASGATVIGSGESPSVCYTGYNMKGTENLCLASDKNIIFMSNADSGYSSTKQAAFTVSGNFVPLNADANVSTSTSGSAPALGTTTYPWASGMILYFDSYRISSSIVTTTTLYSPYIRFSTNEGDFLGSANGSLLDNTAAPAKSIASGTSWVQLIKFTLPSTGRFLVYAIAQFPSNTNGRRGLALSATSASADSALFTDWRAPVNGQVTVCQVSGILTGNQGAAYYLNVCQNSGSALSVTPRLQLIKINGADSL